MFNIQHLQMSELSNPGSQSFLKEQQDNLFDLIKKVLRSNPLSPGSTAVRKLAVKVILNLSGQASDSMKALCITSRLLHDQDYKLREVYVKLMRETLPKLYAQN